MNFKIAILDYGSGNIQSVKNIINYIGYDCEIIHNIDLKFDMYILPGVGSFDSAIKKLKKNNMYNYLCEFPDNKYLIGICLGMQLLCNQSEEGNEKGLGLINADVKKFNNLSLRVPNMGWRDVNFTDDFSQKLGVDQVSRYYFVHSYYVSLQNSIDEIGSTEYGVKFTSALNRDNIYGFQFHPEKSHQYGIRLLKHVIEFCNEQKNNTNPNN